MSLEKSWIRFILTKSPQIAQWQRTINRVFFSISIALTRNGGATYLHPVWQVAAYRDAIDHLDKIPLS